MQHSLPLAPLDKQVALKSPRDSVNAAPLFGPAQVCRCLQTGPTPGEERRQFPALLLVIARSLHQASRGDTQDGEKEVGVGVLSPPAGGAGPAQPQV